MKIIVHHVRILIFIMSFFSMIPALSQQKVIPPEKSDRTTTSNRDFFKYLARAELGIAQGKHSIGDYTLGGIAFPIDVYLGIGIIPGTYLHGAFGVTIMDRPEYSLSNLTYEGTFSMFDVGGGVTVYPTQHKAYVSFTIYATTTAAFSGEDMYNSNVGVAFNIKSGYDLMLGSAFSLGISAFYYFATMNDKPDESDISAKINNSVIGVCLTATLGNL